jgi:hypothetical protein
MKLRLAARQAAKSERLSCASDGHCEDGTGKACSKLDDVFFSPITLSVSLLNLSSPRSEVGAFQVTSRSVKKVAVWIEKTFSVSEPQRAVFMACKGVNH